ncbi:MAG: pyridoxamine 5'-phosphate oxidase [Pontibacterium sp.]
MSNHDYKQLRREYLAAPLDRENLVVSPFDQFALWMDKAVEVSPEDATSMTLATASKTGMPAARIVLLKHFDESGFAWYTDYRSAKGQDLAENPQASLMFYWGMLERQIRIQGTVEKLTYEKACEYFHSRPEGSRFSAAASLQSAPINSRLDLEKKVANLRSQYPEGDVPCPEAWGGYILKPTHFEFWQGRESRLHDRFTYDKQGDGTWTVTRLQP